MLLILVAFGRVSFKVEHFVELMVDKFALVLLVDLEHEVEFGLGVLDEGLVGTGGRGIFFG